MLYTPESGLAACELKNILTNLLNLRFMNFNILIIIIIRIITIL